jgi:hypothetical protein
MNKKVLIIVLALALNISSVAVAQVFAKNMHVPEDVEIAYGSGGEIRVVPPPGFPFPTSELLIHVWDLEEATFGSGDSIIILMWFAGGWLPLAHFTTNLDSVKFFEDLWFSYPAGLKNTIFVPETELKVERHGNEIFASLTSQVIQKMTGGVWNPVTIPAFTIELTKVGGSIHYEGGGPYVKYSVYGDSMGFNANGVFTSGAYTYNTDIDCRIKMQVIYTFTPLSP